MEIIILNLLLSIFLLIILAENTKKVSDLSFKKISQYSKKIQTKEIIPFLLLFLSVILISFFAGKRTFLALYMYTALSFAIFLHFYWLTLNWKIKQKSIFAVIAFLIILFRIIYPNILSHDIFATLTVVWLGPVLTSFKFFTKKLFILISLIWFVYDITYIWLTSTYQHLNATASSNGFPLALITPNLSLGLADLFYASLCISIIKNNKYKILAAILFSGSNILLSLYSLKITIQTFPLLVLWVPIGTAVLILDTIKTKHSN